MIAINPNASAAACNTPCLPFDQKRCVNWSHDVWSIFAQYLSLLPIRSHFITLSAGAEDFDLTEHFRYSLYQISKYDVTAI